MKKSSPLIIEIGKILRNQRKLLGLTLKQVSEKSEVSLAYLSQIEVGKNSASIDTLARISKSIGLKLSDLFSTAENK